MPANLVILTLPSRESVGLLCLGPEILNKTNISLSHHTIVTIPTDSCVKVGPWFKLRWKASDTF